MRPIVPALLAALLGACGSGKTGSDASDAQDVQPDEAQDAPEDAACTTDLECQNGLYCDGEETCDGGSCSPGAPVDCDDSDPCTFDRCSDEEEQCITDPVDADGDGYSAATLPDGTVCDGTDCDDGDGEIHPGAARDCIGGEDRDCDGVADRDEPYGLAGAEIRITSHLLVADNPTIAWSGSEYGLAWKDRRGGNFDIYFARVAPGGAAVGSNVQVTSDPATSEAPVIAWSGSEYAVAWQDNRDGSDEIYFARLSPAGVKTGSDVRVTSALLAQNWPAIAWTGSEYGIAWQDGRVPLDAEIYMATVGPDGSVGPEVRLTSAAGSQSYPALAWAGSELGLVWQDGRTSSPEIYFMRVTPAGVPTLPEVRITSNPEESGLPSLAWTGSEFGLAWVDGMSGLVQVWFTRIAWDGTKPGADLLVGVAVTNLFPPSLVWTEPGFGMAFTDQGAGVFQVYFSRVSHDGASMGPALRVDLDDANSQGPVAAWSGSRFGIAWQDARHGLAQVYFTEVGCR